MVEEEEEEAHFDLFLLPFSPSLLDGLAEYSGSISPDAVLGETCSLVLHSHQASFGTMTAYHFHKCGRLGVAESPK